MSFWRYFKNDIKDTSDQKEFHLQVLEFRLLEGISEINPSCSHQTDSVEVVQIRIPPGLLPVEGFPSKSN